MKTYEVVLAKSYVITIKAINEEQAKEYVSLFTGDVGDISTQEERRKLSFEITDIECRLNETYEVNEITA